MHRQIRRIMLNQYPLFSFLLLFRQNNQNAHGTDALRDSGFTILNGVGEHLAPTTKRRNNPHSRAEMMEIIVSKIKGAYFPHQVNVATWDAALNLDVAKCCGLEEYGTAKNEYGLEYRFAVFRGVGQIKWTGKTAAVACKSEMFQN